jgi:hypothetical protein
VDVGKGVLFDVDEGIEWGYGCPNSPGAKERVEQNPSDELMISVKPSDDLDSVSKKDKIVKKISD